MVRCLLELGAAEFDQAPALLDSLQDRLRHTRIHLVVVLVQVLLLNAATAQVLVCQLVEGQHELVRVLYTFLIVLQLRWLLVHELIDSVALN